MLATAGWAVDHAISAASGLVLAQQHHYDIVVADLILTDLSGRELVRRIRNTALSRPLLILSRVNGANARAIAMEAGADAYLEKPIDRKRLLDGLKGLLGYSSKPALPRPSSCGSSGVGRDKIDALHSESPPSGVSDSFAFPISPAHQHPPSKGKSDDRLS